MEEQRQASPEGSKKISKAKPILLILLAIALMITASGGAYYWQHKKLNRVQLQLAESSQNNNTLKSEAAALNKQVSSLKSQLKNQPQSRDLSTTQTSPATVDNLNIKVIDGYRYYTTKYPNNPYIVVDVTLTNIGKSSLAVPVSSFSLRDSSNNGGADLGELGGTTMPNGKTVLGDQTLSTGQSVTGGLVFSAFDGNYTLYTLSYKDQAFPIDASMSVNQ